MGKKYKNMKFNIAYPVTGAQKMYNIDDEHKWGKLVDRRMGSEFDGEILGDEFKGYVFKITGGCDNDGFPMKQGILIKGRVRLILEPESIGFICHKDKKHHKKVKKAKKALAKKAVKKVIKKHHKKVKKAKKALAKKAV